MPKDNRYDIIRKDKATSSQMIQRLADRHSTELIYLHTEEKSSRNYSLSPNRINFGQKEFRDILLQASLGHEPDFNKMVLDLVMKKSNQRIPEAQAYLRLPINLQK